MQNDPLFGISHQLVLSLLRLRSACPAVPTGGGELGLGAKGFTVLFTLCHHPEGPLTMSRLAACLGLSQPQLSKIVAPLEEQRLVCRRHDEMNRRLVHISVTSEGRSLMETVTREAAGDFLPLLGSLSPEECRRLAEALDTLDTLLEKSGCRSW